MSGSEKINLSEIANISEDEFKKQLLAWIDERGVSRTLQSKLRAELFEHFNRTQLGRQIAVQHQKSHRIELSPLVLVLNTLVAEFLYAENCHFTLSVFSAEVPYKNTLPDFEGATSTTQQPFRLSERELKDIFEAIGLTEANAKTIRKFYASCDSAGGGGGGNHNSTGKSLFYCIFKILFTGTDVNATKTNARNGVNNESVLSVGTSSSAKCAHCSMSQKKFKKYQISSRYFKYLNRYLDILTDRMRDMSKSLAEMHSENPSKRKSIAETSAALESSLKTILDKINENVNHLTKSTRKSRKLRDFLQSIDRLSSNLEICTSNMERLLVTVANECSDLKRPPVPIEKNEKHIDVDYCTWLQELKTSENGRRFVSRLEASLQKTLAKEQESIERIYEEKMKNYRMLIKLHYKQKYAKSGKSSSVDSPVAKDAVVKASKKGDASIECNQRLSNALNQAANEKREYVDRIVQSAKARLKQLENESENLDKSFQAYLKQQTTQKIQLNEDISSIWHDYTFGKVLLQGRNLTAPYKTLLPHQMPATDLKIQKTSLAAEIDALTQIDSEKSFENPFKQFAAEKLFLKLTPISATTKVPDISSVKTIDFANQRDIWDVESLLQTISSESSYGRLPSPKRNGLDNGKEIQILDKPVAPVVNQKEEPPIRRFTEKLDSPKNNGNTKEIMKIDSRDDEQNQSYYSSDATLATSPESSPLSEDIDEPQKISVEIEPAADVNNLPLQTQKFVGTDHDSVTDDELEESLEISIGPKHDASSSEDVWN